MSKQHENPYKRKNYKLAFANIMKKGIVTFAEVVSFFRELKDKHGKLLTVAAAESSARVLLGPTEDNQGNFSAQGWAYYMERLKDKKLRLRWRNPVQKRLCWNRKTKKHYTVDMLAKAVKKTVKVATVKKTVKAKTAKVKVVAAVKDTAPVAPVAPAAPAVVETVEPKATA
jgi:hypothetical protein